jgi:hypothetical protein
MPLWMNEWHYVEAFNDKSTIAKTTGVEAAKNLV